MRMELITVTTDDGAELDGTYYGSEVDTRPPAERKAVFFTHGKTLNFYTGISRFAPPVLAAAGYDCLALNRRAHDIASIRRSFDPEGDGWATPADHKLDVATGVDYLKRLGYREIALVGHSLGGWLAAQHAAGDPVVKALVLASPSDAWVGAGRRLKPHEKEAILREAQSLVEIGLPKNPVLLPRWPWLSSAEVVIASIAGEQLPRLSEHLKGYQGALLALCGTEGVDAMLLEPARRAVEGSAAIAKEFVTLSRCDHFYVGFEDKVSALVRDWLLANFPA